MKTQQHEKSKDSDVHSAGITKKQPFFAKIVLYVAAFYFSLVFISGMLSMFLSNEALGIMFREDMASKKCHSSPKIGANPLLVWDFYIHYDYWLSDYKGDISILNSRECYENVRLLLMDKEKASFAFIDNEGKNIVIMKKQKLLLSVGGK